jgi:hypothetical protein
MADRDSERSAAEIRREIERTRHQMDETVEQIGDKLSAAKILDEMWTRFRSGDGPAMLGEAIRDHPKPFALMGLGIGLLAVEQSRGRQGGGRDRPGDGAGTYERAEGRVGPYRGDAVDRDDADWEHAGTGTKVKSHLHDAADTLKSAAGSVRDKAGELKEAAAGAGERVREGAHHVREKAGAARERVSEVAHDAQSKVAGAAHAAHDGVAHAAEAVREKSGEMASAARERAGRGAERAKDGFWQMLDENPMALGAIAFGLGVASGLSAPTTRFEDEKLGRRSHAMKERVRTTVSETAQKAKRVAHDASDAARAELKRQREETGPIQVAMNQLKQSAKEIGQAAQEAARERAESESLTVEGVKSQIRGDGRRARETAGADSTD